MGENRIARLLYKMWHVGCFDQFERVGGALFIASLQSLSVNVKRAGFNQNHRGLLKRV
jgi:hypothetical protein